jgi:chromosome segregation ATPase
LDISESLKAERGRNTITQAELETVEGRLRELEEIERELEASGIETKEELKILNKKERELSNKNDALKEEIAASMQKVGELMSQMQVSAEMQAQVDEMKVDLLQTQDKIAMLLQQIEQGNEQYFILKKRYDALDIEYAQLFEKFSEAEAALGSKKA